MVPSVSFSAWTVPLREGSQNICIYLRLSNHFDISDDVATAMPTGTKKVIGASESSITKHMAISGACCEAESNEAAPIKAHALPNRRKHQYPYEAEHRTQRGT